MLVLLTACDQQAQPEPKTTAPPVSGLDLDAMDTRIDPGDDFYGYANGTWVARTAIPPDRPGLGTFATVRRTTQEELGAIIDSALTAAAPTGTAAQKIADLYRSFVDIEGRNARGTAPLDAEFAAIDAIRDRAGLARYFARANRYGLDMPISIDQSVDWTDPGRYVMVVSQGGLGLPDRSYYLDDDPATTRIRDRYVAHIERMFVLAGRDAEAAAAIVALETRLAEAQMHAAALRNRAQNFRVFARGDIDEVMPSFAWDAFLTTYGVPDIDRLVLYTRNYLKKLDGILIETDLETWKAYLAWTALNSSAALLTSELDALNFEFYGRALSGTAEPRSLRRRGIGIVDNALGDLVGRAYVAEHFSPGSRERVLGLVAELVRGYRQRLTELDWISEATRAEALEKLSSLRIKVGHPDVWRDYAFEIRSDDLNGNLRRAAAAEHSRRIARHAGPVDRAEWHVTPQTVNAYYGPALNEVVLPAAILRPPLFNPAAEEAVNYGAIGALVGHEIGHAFDDQGSSFDAAGKLREWWAESDRREFARRTARLIEQYDRFRPFADLGVDGELTQGENIGDLGGISIALLAYRLSLAGRESPVIDGFSGEQRLLIGFAQMWRDKYRDAYLRQLLLTSPHPPGVYRTNGVLRNVPTFYSAFDVTPDDALYLPVAERVRIW